MGIECLMTTASGPTWTSLTTNLSTRWQSATSRDWAASWSLAKKPSKLSASVMYVSASTSSAAIDLGPDQGGIGEQLEDPGPDERIQGVLPNRPVVAAAPLWETVGVGAEATIVDAPAARGPRRATVERVAADLTDQQALQQGRLLGVPGGEAPILVEAFLGERELRRSDQRRHGNLDPFRARAWT